MTNNVTDSKNAENRKSPNASKKIDKLHISTDTTTIENKNFKYLKIPICLIIEKIILKSKASAKLLDLIDTTLPIKPKEEKTIKNNIDNNMLS